MIAEMQSSDMHIFLNAIFCGFAHIIDFAFHLLRIQICVTATNTLPLA
jgi:hypothetical protein